MVDNPFCLLARPARFERATYGLEVRCSIQLSYGRVIGYSIFMKRSIIIEHG